MRMLFFIFIFAFFFVSSEASAQQGPNRCPPDADWCRVRIIEQGRERVRGGYPPQGNYGRYRGNGGHQNGGVYFNTPDVNVCSWCRTQVQPPPQYRQQPPQQYGGYVRGYPAAPPPQQCEWGYQPGMTPNGPGCIRSCPPGSMATYDSTGRPACHHRGW